MNFSASWQVQQKSRPGTAQIPASTSKGQEQARVTEQTRHRDREVTLLPAFWNKVGRSPINAVIYFLFLSLDWSWDSPAPCWVPYPQFLKQWLQCSRYSVSSQWGDAWIDQLNTRASRKVDLAGSVSTNSLRNTHWPPKIHWKRI